MRKAFIFLGVTLSLIFIAAISVFATGILAKNEDEPYLTPVENILSREANLDQLPEYDFEQFRLHTAFSHEVKPQFGSSSQLCSLDVLDHSFPLSFLRRIGNNHLYTVYKLKKDDGTIVYEYIVFVRDKATALWNVTGECYFVAKTLSYWDVEKITTGMNAAEAEATIGMEFADFPVLYVTPDDFKDVGGIVKTKEGYVRADELQEDYELPTDCRKNEYLLTSDGIAKIEMVANPTQSGEIATSEFTVESVTLYPFGEETDDFPSIILLCDDLVFP